MIKLQYGTFYSVLGPKTQIYTIYTKQYWFRSGSQKKKELFGDLLGLNLLIFFVNYFCLQNELFMLMAIFWS